jgi:hypothetical protein
MARYDDLTKMLSGLGEKDLRIKKAVIVKLGALMLAELTIPPTSEFPITEREALTTDSADELPREDVASRIQTALKDHPNIFEPELLLEMPESKWGSKFGFFTRGTIFQYRVHLPKAKQKYTDMDSVEHFSVLTNGSAFAAYCEIEDFPILSSIGHEFRELAQAQIAKETSFKSPTLGPCPIHPDVVVVVREIAAGGAEVSVKRYHQDDNIFIVTSDSRSNANIVLDCFFDFGRSIENFYDLLSARDELLDLHLEVNNHFSAASKNTLELLAGC